MDLHLFPHRPQDFELFLEPSFVVRLKETILDNCVTALVMALLAKFPQLNEAFITRRGGGEGQAWSAV